MPIPVLSTQQFTGGARILGLPAAIANDEPVVLSQLANALNGISWKDNARASSTGNISLAAPGATLDGVALANGDRVLIKNQTTATENGIYIWTGAATALTRPTDADTYEKLESAIITIDEGAAGAGTKWRQTGVNGAIGANSLIWVPDGSAAPAASEATAGVVQISTQAIADAGTNDLQAITPLKLKNSPYSRQAINQAIGDGSATTFSVTHSYNTYDVDVVVREATGARRKILVETDTPDVNTARVIFASAPAATSYRVTVSKVS